MTKWRKNRDASEGKDALPLPHYTNHEQAIEQAIAQAGINMDEAAVAVTRDGKIYVGTAIPPTKLQKTIMKSKFLVRLLMWVGKTVNFFFVRVYDCHIRSIGYRRSGRIVATGREIEEFAARRSSDLS